MIASTTQIHVKGPVATVRLLIHIWRVRRQLARTPGLVALAFHRGWRTLTVWESAEALKRFRDSGAHLDAMRDMGRIGRAKTATWAVAEVPAWPEVIERLDRIA
ncbi:MAG: DUF3291 domain-containing protein [Lentisphaerae bacterium]|nr:DUF3291 domain-containing protein [Lentisphaerota bacterium]